MKQYKESFIMYRKINAYIDGKYFCSTNQRKTCIDFRNFLINSEFIIMNGYKKVKVPKGYITCFFSK